MPALPTPLHLFDGVALEPVTLRGGCSSGAATGSRCCSAPPTAIRRRSSAPTYIGAPLARLELAIALDALFERLPDLSLAATPHYRDSWHFRGLGRLELRFRRQQTTLTP